MNLVQGIVDTVPLLLEQLPVIIESLITFFTENMPLILEQGIQILTNLAMGIVQLFRLCWNSYRPSSRRLLTRWWRICR